MIYRSNNNSRRVEGVYLVCTFFVNWILQRKIAAPRGSLEVRKIKQLNRVSMSLRQIQATATARASSPTGITSRVNRYQYAAGEGQRTSREGERHRRPLESMVRTSKYNVDYVERKNLDTFRIFDGRINTLENPSFAVLKRAILPILGSHAVWTAVSRSHLHLSGYLGEATPLLKSGAHSKQHVCNLLPLTCARATGAWAAVGSLL